MTYITTEVSHQTAGKLMHPWPNKISWDDVWVYLGFMFQKVLQERERGYTCVCMCVCVRTASLVLLIQWYHSQLMETSGQRRERRAISSVTSLNFCPVHSLHSLISQNLSYPFKITCQKQCSLSRPSGLWLRWCSGCPLTMTLAIWSLSWLHADVSLFKPL